jgi:hypothetical protein
MTHPAILTGSLSLRDFNLAAYGDPLILGGELTYRVRLHVRRDDDWLLVGAISLNLDEWTRLANVFQAHEGQRAKLPS